MMVRFLHILLCFIPMISFGQELSATLNHTQILVGEQVTYTIKIVVDPKTKIDFEPYQAMIPAKLQNANTQLTSSKKIELEILEPFTDTLIKGKKKDTWIGKFTITCWDSGTVVLPEPMVVISDSTFYFPETRLNCNLVPSKKNQDLYDIREQFADVPDPKTKLDKVIDFIWQNGYTIFPLLMLALFILIQLRRHKKASKPAPKVAEVSLKDRTILAIESLEKQKMWEKGKLKTHYVELSYIMRAYLSSRYELNLLEKTTIETRLLLKQVGLHPETIDGLMTILNQADMVKFAKSVPDEITILKVSILAKQIVAETSPIEFENA